MKKLALPYEAFLVKNQHILTAGKIKKAETARLDRSAPAFLCAVALLIILMVNSISSWAEDLTSGSADAGETAPASEKFDSLLSKAFRHDEPGVAVIAVNKGEVVFRKGYGMANMELSVPIRPEMVFRIGSVTKIFTATAVMILVEKGLISLDDEISRYLPEYPVHGERKSPCGTCWHTRRVS